MITLTINGKTVQAPQGSTILEAAQLAGVSIPTLCYLEGIHKIGSCRICVVEVEGARNLQASCIVPATEGMKVRTNSARVMRARKDIYDLILSNHPQDCLHCSRNQHCELQALGTRLGIVNPRFASEPRQVAPDVSSPSVHRDMTKCILCRRCVTVCAGIQEVGALAPQHRGYGTVIGPAMDEPLAGSNCANCGQCTVVCPVGALQEADATQQVAAALADPEKHVVVQVAPAIRAAIGEEFGMPPGSRVSGKLAAALKALGFADVFDTNFAADLTIIEEGTELLHRLGAALNHEHIHGPKALPMITSCSPGWVKFVEHTFPEQLDHLSTCKSPHAMLGALIKSYYAQKQNIPPEKLYTVSIMPCTAKKFEIGRPELQNNGVPNVDAVLTTRELASMIRGAGIDFANLEDAAFDAPLSLNSGAADIFGVTGGVMEAALRTVYELVTGRELPFEGLHVTPIVGLDRIKTAELTFQDVKPEYAWLEGVTAKIAVTSGFAGARQLLDEIKDGKSPYHFIEVMGCPGGCITGGGQPRGNVEELRKLRLQALYAEDESKTLRKSHENTAVMELYEVFLEKPNGPIPHELLHTTYVPRGLYNERLEKTAGQ